MLAWRMILPQRSFSETVKAANSSGLIELGRAAHGVKPYQHLRLGCHGADVGVDLVDDLARRALGGIVAGPGRQQKIGQAGLGRRRDVGQRGIALAVAQQQALERAAVDGDLGVDRVDHHEGEQAALDVGDRLRIALVADIDRLDAGRELVELGGDAGRQRPRPEIVLARLGLQLGRELGCGLDRAFGIDQQDEGRGEHARDRREVLDRIVGELVVERGIDGLRHGRGGKQREAVRLGARHQFGGRYAVAAAPVVDHHRLAPQGRQTLGIDPRADVGGRTRRKRDDDGDPS